MKPLIKHTSNETKTIRNLKCSSRHQMNWGSLDLRNPLKTLHSFDFQKQLHEFFILLRGDVLTQQGVAILGRDNSNFLGGHALGCGRQGWSRCQWGSCRSSGRGFGTIICWSVLIIIIPRYRIVTFIPWLWVPNLAELCDLLKHGPYFGILTGP